MDWNTIVEIIGYVGSALVLVSMLMTSVVRLRIINLTGSVIFAVYALLIRSYPTAIMNICLAGINIYHLRRLTSEEKQYDLVSVDLRDPFVTYLLRRNEEDIRKWIPEFSTEGIRADIACLVTCEGNPAGLFLADKVNGEDLEILLDYAMPVYRDTSVGRYLHRKLAEESYRSLIFRQNAPNHTEYLETVGYRKNTAGEYVLDLSGLRK